MIDLKKNKCILFHGMLAVIALVYLYGGILEFIGLPMKIIAYIAYFGWLFLAFINDRNYVNRLVFSGWPIYFLFIINYLASNIQSNAIVINNRTVFLYISIIHSIGLYYYDKKRLEERRFIFFALLVNIVFVSIKTHSALTINPLVSRYLATGLEKYSYIIEQQSIEGIVNVSLDEIKGVGSYGFFNSLVFLIIPLLYYIQFSKNKKLNICVFALLIFLSYLSIRASFMISITICFLAMLFLLITKGDSQRKNRLLIVSFLLLPTFLLSGMFSSILYFIANNIDNQTLSVRLSEIAYASKLDLSSTSDFWDRLRRFGMSFNTFFFNPILGSIGKADLSGRIGGHATGIDVFAMYGISGSLYHIFWLNCFKEFQGIVFKENRLYSTVGIVSFVFMLFFNNIASTQIFIGIIIILPFGLDTVYHIIYDKNEISEKQSCCLLNSKC